MNKLLRPQRWLIAYNSVISASRCNVRLYCIRRIKPISCRRIKRNNDVYIEEMKAEQLKYKGGKKGQMVVRSGMENALRSIGLSQRQFVEQDPLTEDDQDNFDDAIVYGEEFYDIRNKEIQERKNFIKKKRTIRKYFREPSETNLLTVAAKEQIKYLHNLDPIQWDAEKLSQSFPISIAGVKKLLRSKVVLQSTERQQKHDKSVSNNIKLLKEGKGGISTITQSLWKEGKLKLEYSVGNVNLPMPDNNETNKSVQLQTKQYPERVGQFLSIVKSYLDLKEKKLLADTVPKPTVNENLQCNKKENLWEVTVGSSPPQYNSEDNSDDPLCASYLARKINTSNPDITFENVHRNMKKDISLDCNHEQTSKKSDDTVIETVNPTSFNNENVQKYENDAVELLIDSKSETSNVEVYLYNSKVGYQYPLGKSPEYPNKITIPCHLYKPGCKYKIGNCYYDEDGNFLYRTFV